MTLDASAVRVGYNISPLFSESGEKTGLILTFQDLTEIRAMGKMSAAKDNLAAGRVVAELTMPDGGKLKIKLEEIAGKRIRILFEDTDCGMSPAQVEQLFEPLSASTTSGTGLGLSVVYQIIRDHNGTINVRSGENARTTITVELPTDIRAQNISADELKSEDENITTRLEDFLTLGE